MDQQRPSEETTNQNGQPLRRKRGRPPKHPREERPPTEGSAVPSLVDAVSLADILAVPPPYVYDLVKREAIPVIRVGKYLRFSVIAVLQELERTSKLVRDHPDSDGDGCLNRSSPSRN